MKKLIKGLLLVMLLVPVSCAAPPAPERGPWPAQPEIIDITITGYHSTRDIEGNYDPDSVEGTLSWVTNKPCYYCFEVRPVDFDYPSNSGGYEKFDVNPPLPEELKHSSPIVLKSGKVHLYDLTIWDKEKNYFTKSDTFWAPVVPKTTPPPAPAPAPPPDKGPVLPAVFNATDEVRQDLIKRGLIIETTTGGQIKVGEIEKLVEQGVYALNAEGNLVFGPNYRPPSPL